MAADLKVSRLTKVRRLMRRGSSNSSARSASIAKEQQHSPPALNSRQPRRSASLTKLAEVKEQQLHCLDSTDGAVQTNNNNEHRRGSATASQPTADRRSETLLSGARQPGTATSSTSALIDLPTPVSQKPQPILTVEEPTPDPIAPARTSADDHTEDARESLDLAHPLPSPQQSSVRSRPIAGTVRRQSLVNSSNARVVKSLLDQEQRPTTASSQEGYFAPSTFDPNMMHRKIWVKRPGASATLVQIREDDLVDDVRDMILRKYANSLGRTFDAPDLTLRIVPRDASRDRERLLEPEEEICRTLDHYFAGGQHVDEALLIDIPQRRTPKPSPRAGPGHQYPYNFDEPSRPVENGTDYFGTAAMAHSPAALTTVSHDSRASHATQNPAQHPHDRAMAVLTTGVVPPLPSPGGRTRTHQVARPRTTRTHTSSPTTIVNPGFSTRPSRQRRDSTASDSRPGNPATTRLKRRPQTDKPRHPQPQTASPPPRPKRPARESADPSPPPRSSRDTLSAPIHGPARQLSPPINVLIVEDNIINLKLLEAFMKRLKVRWATAMNGRAAVDKWRGGGFHLVLMDIQLPIMSGLEATKEIRRLERVNGIGVFSLNGPASSGTPGVGGHAAAGGAADGAADAESGGHIVGEEDRLEAEKLFKSPVIIVALTASSLQSDRHEALAAGCNDFLTKPVNFVWLERKVKEWGCMQALIDFDGWRKWKHFSEDQVTPKAIDKSQKNAAARPAVDEKQENERETGRGRKEEGAAGARGAGSDGSAEAGERDGSEIRENEEAEAETETEDHAQR
ncbi:Two-component response regulator SSK1p [Coniosporium tulheliwenetii]|uniref:Two-component response regulator SSK1p n=1 Tax=Coniosporium tulheliwenetii TaxID=3383036 RepID=A0ACC2ZDY5_9PEZI|nr:Two-component response regulator SSK1p [Cladosporium sp. JES 115]